MCLTFASFLPISFVFSVFSFHFLFTYFSSSFYLSCHFSFFSTFLAKFCLNFLLSLSPQFVQFAIFSLSPLSAYCVCFFFFVYFSNIFGALKFLHFIYFAINLFSYRFYLSSFLSFLLALYPFIVSTPHQGIFSHFRNSLIFLNEVECNGVKCVRPLAPFAPNIGDLLPANPENPLPSSLAQSIISCYYFLIKTFYLCFIFNLRSPAAFLSLVLKAFWRLSFFSFGVFFLFRGVSKFVMKRGTDKEEDKEWEKSILTNRPCFHSHQLN